jgi:hypothetical protein
MGVAVSAHREAIDSGIIIPKKFMRIYNFILCFIILVRIMNCDLVAGS